MKNLFMLAVMLLGTSVLANAQQTEPAKSETKKEAKHVKKEKTKKKEKEVKGETKKKEKSEEKMEKAK